MNNFIFYNPTRVFFGTGEINKLIASIPCDATILFIYGVGSIKKNGIYDKVVKQLEKHKIFEFFNITSNPRYEYLINGIDIIKKNNIDFILAVGGGSVIDAAKFLAAASQYNGTDIWDIVTNPKNIKTALPIGVVLTIPATGSETNKNAVISKNGYKTVFSSHWLHPKFCVLDPTTTFTLTNSQISNGIVDAFVHILEQYLTYKVDAKIQDRFSEGLLLTLLEDGPIALSSSGRENLAVRENIMWSASLALNGLIGSGVPQDWSTHMIGHELTSLYNIEHASTLSIILPAVLKVRKKEKHKKLVQYAERVWNLLKGTEEEKVAQSIQLTQLFFKKMNMPTHLKEVGISISDLTDIIDQLSYRNLTNLGENKDITLKDSYKILLRAM